MRAQSARRLAWLAGGLYVLLFAASLIFDAATKPTKGHPGLDIGEVIFTLSTAAFPIAAILILARQPRNRIGWILMAIGVAWVIELIPTERSPSAEAFWGDKWRWRSRPAPGRCPSC
jgi:hypothetical protein